MPFAGELSALLTALLWSGTSIAFTEASIRVGSVTVNMTRLILALVYLLITILLMGGTPHLSGTQVLNLSISGLIGLVFGDTYLFKAYQHIGARISMLMMSLAPPISAVLAYFVLGETVSLLGILGILITITGIALVVLTRKENPTSDYKISKVGIFYAFLGAVGQAAGLIFAKLAFNEGEIDGFTATFIRIFASALVMYPVLLLANVYRPPIKTYLKNKKAFVFTVVGSIIGPYLGITFSLIAIKYTKIGIAATLMATVPIIMLPLVRYYYKEKLSASSVIGAVLAVAGIAILFLK